MNISCVALAVLAVGMTTRCLSADFRLVRRALDAYERAEGGPGWEMESLQNWGVVANLEYRKFAVLVSNDYRNVFANVENVVTNDAERLLVFSAGWQFGEGFYLSCLDELADLALGGRVTADEIRWYAVLNYNSRLTNILRIRYREPLVTNIVHKLMRVDPGRRTYYGRILDGSSYRDYLDEMKACLWD